MSFRPSFNFFIYLIIFLVGSLNLALMLGTLNLVLGAYPLLPALDLLRAEFSFFAFIGFFSACYLMVVPRLLWMRRMLVVLLAGTILSIAHTAAVLAQLTSEAGPMHKVLFYVNYLKSPWLNDQSFEFFILYIVPTFLMTFLAVVYFYCIPASSDAGKFKKRFRVYLSIALLSLAVGFIPPIQKELPYSLSHNAVLYLVKTGYVPQKDIYKHDKNAHYQPWYFSKTESVLKKNVVLIILESTQNEVIAIGEHKPYGDLTPFLDQLSKENSLLFKKAFGTIPHTSKALVGIHCGILPFQDLPIYESIYGIPVKCLPELLSEQGYQTVFMQSATEKYENRRELVHQFGYQDFISAETLKGSSGERNNSLGFEDKVLVGQTEEWLLGKKEQPFLITILSLTAHHSYQTPSDFEKKTYVEKPLKNSYLNAIRYTDEFLAELFEVFKKTGNYQNSIFIIVSDHGEAFGEHGEQLHNNVAYNEVANIFLMVHDPARSFLSESGIENRAVSQLQILPSVFDMLGYQSETEVSMGSFFRENSWAIGGCYERLMCNYIVRGDYKYIFNFRERLPELYHIHDDVREANNLAERKPELLASMHKDLMLWYDFHQSAYHNYYAEQNPYYAEEIAKTVLYSIYDMKNSLHEISSGQDH